MEKGASYHPGPYASREQLDTQQDLNWTGELARQKPDPSMSTEELYDFYQSQLSGRYEKLNQNMPQNLESL